MLIRVVFIILIPGSRSLREICSKYRNLQFLKDSRRGGLKRSFLNLVVSAVKMGHPLFFKGNPSTITIMNCTSSTWVSNGALSS